MKFIKGKWQKNRISKSVGTRKLKHSAVFVLIVTIIMAVPILGFNTEVSKCKEGSLYTCNVHANYRNPETGKVEDSGGESSYATGQGMVSSVVDKKGLIEVTKEGDVYLTVRMSLMDKTSGHAFAAHKKGESGWSKVSAGITGKGRNSKGATADVCMKLPSKDGIIKGQMYVKPMGRAVVFFINTDNFTRGNSSGLKPAIVTSDNGKGKEILDSGDNKEKSSGNKEKSSNGEATEGENELTKKSDSRKAQGLSLSTGENQKKDVGKGSGKIANQIMVTIIGVVIGGIFLMIIMAATLYLMRNRLKEIFQSYPDDEYIYEREDDDERK